MGLSSFSLKGKVATVTGGRRGIGRAIALALAEAGAHVAVCDLVAGDEMEAVAEEIKGLGRLSLAIRTDTTRKSDVDNLAQRVMDEFGGIDILVNNAAINILIPLLDTSEDDWDKVINVNLKGYYLCSQAIGKKMVERKRGSIINMASRLAFQANPGMWQSAYCIATIISVWRIILRILNKSMRSGLSGPTVFTVPIYVP